MPSTGRTAFPLVPRYRLTGLPFGSARSTRRGRGSDLAGFRAYVPGDPDLDDRLARHRAALVRARRRRVRRPGAFRRRSSVRRRRRRPAALDEPLSRLVALALEARAQPGGDRGDRRECDRRSWRRRLPRLGTWTRGEARAVLDLPARPVSPGADRGTRPHCRIRRGAGLAQPRDRIPRPVGRLARRRVVRLRSLRLPGAAVPRALVVRDVAGGSSSRS